MASLDSLSSIETAGNSINQRSVPRDETLLRSRAEKMARFCSKAIYCVGCSVECPYEALDTCPLDYLLPNGRT